MASGGGEEEGGRTMREMGFVVLFFREHTVSMRMKACICSCSCSSRSSSSSSTRMRRMTTKGESVGSGERQRDESSFGEVEEREGAGCREKKETGAALNSETQLILSLQPPRRSARALVCLPVCLLEKRSDLSPWYVLSTARQRSVEENERRETVLDARSNER